MHAALLSLVRLTVAVLLGLALGLAEVRPTFGQEPKQEKKEEKKPDPPKVEKKEEKLSPKQDLEQRLKVHEDKLAEIRKAMLQECDEAIKKVDERIKKAEKDLAAAGRDPMVRSAAFRALTQARRERLDLTLLRGSIERRVQPATPPQPSRRPAQGIGFQVTAIPPVLAPQLGLKKDQGVVVSRVNDGSPAASAGVKVGDILLKIDGKEVSSNPTAVQRTLAALKPGAPVPLVVQRQGKQETLEVKLAAAVRGRARVIPGVRPRPRR